RRPGVREGPRATGGRHASDVEDVLHADRHAVQRPAKAARARLALALARGGPRAVGVDEGPRGQAIVEATDPREACLDQIDGAHAAGPDALGRLARAEPGELNGGHRAPRPRPRSARTTASGRRPRSESARR